MYNKNKEGCVSMRFQIVGRNVEISNRLEDQITKKLNILEKYLIIKEDTECRVVVSLQPNGKKIEVTIPTKFAILRSEVVDRDLYTAIDLVVDKLENQIERAKAKLDCTNREKFSKTFVLNEIKELELSEEPVRTKNIELTTMSLDTAIANLELLGHTFYIYRDDEEEKVAVVYKRNKGGYGLIEID